MASPHRPQFPDALYHVTARGVDRQPLARDDVDRELWVAILSDAVRATGALLHAWCLMTNHSHLLIQTPLGNIYRGVLPFLAINFGTLLIITYVPAISMVLLGK